MQKQVTYIDLKPGQLLEQVKSCIQKNQESLEQLLSVDVPMKWDERFLPLEKMHADLENTWNTLSHLNHVSNTEETYQAYAEGVALVSKYDSEMMHNEKLYNWILSYSQSDDFSKINTPQRKIMENWLRDFKLSGIELSPENKKIFKELELRLSEIESQFEQNVLRSTQEGFVQISDRESLQGLPEQELDRARQKAIEKGIEGWVLTLDFPSYYTAMTHIEDGAIRERLYKAYTTRASKYSENKLYDNTPLMLEILEKRHQLARLLGYKNYAEYALQVRMVKTPEAAKSFLQNLLNKVKSRARKDFEELKGFAGQEVNAWDVLYFSEKLADKQLGVSQEYLRKYFPLEKVVEGLFSIVHQLFQITFNEVKKFDRWDEKVRLFEIFDKDKQVRGLFYLDLLARDNKQSGAWVSQAQARFKTDKEDQLPITYVCTNFSDREQKGSVWITHDDVVTLFHEFGHCLHYVLTLIDYPSISGGNGVEWDGVECPSQLLENWCWNKECLKKLTQNVETGERLSDEDIAKLKQYKHFEVGLDWIRQLEFALFDLELHTNCITKDKNHVIDVLNNIRDQQTGVYPVPEYNQFPNTFGHIFGGGYAAGYYSYLWSQVLSSDIFDWLESSGDLFNRDITQRYLSTILEQGGSKPFMKLFVECRGRDPDISGLLKQSGLMD